MELLVELIVWIVKVLFGQSKMTARRRPLRRRARNFVAQQLQEDVNILGGKLKFHHLIDEPHEPYRFYVQYADQYGELQTTIAIIQRNPSGKLFQPTEWMHLTSEEWHLDEVVEPAALKAYRPNIFNRIRS